MSRVRNVFFDAGGTLVDVEYRHLRDVVDEGLAAPGGEARELPSDEAFTRGENEARAWFIGHLRAGAVPQDAWRGYFERVYAGAGFPRESLGPILERLWRRNLASGLWHRPVPGAEEALARLKAAGLRLAVISNAEGRVADDLAQAGLAHWFDAIVDSHKVGVAKPDPRIFSIALARLEARADESVYVGDIHGIDVVGARAAGLAAVLLDRWGLQADADAERVTSLEELASRVLDRAA